MAETISRSIFKAYDIRGIVDKMLTEEVCEKVGMALGTLAQKKNVSHICVGQRRPPERSASAGSFNERYS